MEDPKKAVTFIAAQTYENYLRVLVAMHVCLDDVERQEDK